MELLLEPPSPPALRASGLVKDYPRGRAVDGVDPVIRGRSLLQVAGECNAAVNGPGEILSLSEN